MAFVDRLRSFFRGEDRSDTRDPAAQRWTIRDGPPETLADRLPWFGEPPFAPGPQRRSSKAPVADTQFARRVLLS